MSYEKEREQLRAAYNHNSHARAMASCNHAYMGSMASWNLATTLGGDGTA